MSEFVSAFKGESGGWNEEKWAYQYPEVCPGLMPRFCAAENRRYDAADVN